MRALYDSKSKTIDDRGMKTLLAQPARVQSWLDVEAALALSQAEYGMIPPVRQKILPPTVASIKST